MINNSVNFKGVPVAQIIPKDRRKNSEIMIYELDQLDIPYMLKMAHRLDLGFLNPNAKSHNGYMEWKNIIDGGIGRIGFMPTYLAVSNKRPCGIMAYNCTLKESNFLSILATWPTLPDNKVKYAGLSLVAKLIKDSIKMNAPQIDVNPAHCAPNGKNCRTFYEQIGFKPDDEAKAFMVLNNSEFYPALNSFKSKFSFKKLCGQQNYDLFKVLKFNDESFFDKFKKLFAK